MILKNSNDSMSLSTSERDKLIKKTASAYEKVLDALGFDWRNDPNMSDTPNRVAKSFVDDLIVGCYTDQPKITAFENVNKYDGLVFQGNIDVMSICSHHHLPFIGHAHVAYLPDPNGKIIGLSKLNRTVEWFARRPQVQENLTQQIHDFLNITIEGNAGIAVMIEASHMCACVRGVKHDSTMMTSKLSGAFKDNPAVRDEFYNFVKRLEKQ